MQGNDVRLGLPVDPTVLFADKKGVQKPGIEKRRMKLLQNLGFLGKFLDADERIMMVTTGCSPFSFFEQWTMGALWVQLLKRAVLVFTNKRLFHIPVTSQLRYRGSIAQVLYQDCKWLRIKGSALVIEYHSGKKEKFLGIPWGDRAIIKRFQLQAAEGEQPSALPRRNHLCPNCTYLLPQETLACPSCGLEFKNKSKSLVYSLLLPGGGYFYAGHHALGLLDALVESFLLLAVVVNFFEGLGGNPEGMTSAFIVGIFLVFEKLVTIFHSNGFLAEFIPIDLKAVLSGRPAPVAPSPAMPAPAPTPSQRQHSPEDILSLRSQSPA
ncbi:MAG: hypothetical protein A2Y77_12335 [Planctomycetes bacterium RBG_13_62_9]|nr:MAG: hypothetical protein A2Y77_12335 [Planctomycetes bacterium RBG_13_62_9]